MKKSYLVDNKVKIDNVEYEKVKEFVYDGKKFIEVLNKDIWQRMLLQENDKFEYCTIDDKEYFYQVLRDNYVQSPDLVF